MGELKVPDLRQKHSLRYRGLLAFSGGMQADRENDIIKGQQAPYFDEWLRVLAKPGIKSRWQKPAILMAQYAARLIAHGRRPSHPAGRD